MSAPDRIWVDAEYITNPHRSLAFRNHVTHVRAHSLNDETEYVRADIAADLLAALEAAVDALHNAEKRLTEELHHMDFCGESLPLTNARAAIARARGAA